MYWSLSVAELAPAFGITPPGVTTIYEADPRLPPGARGLFAYAAPSELTLRLSGPGWAERDADAEALLLRNAAHEVAHAWQLSLGAHVEDAPRWLHEGFAEALAREALAGRRVAEASSRCGAVLRAGPVRSAQRFGDEAAIYDCGAVVVAAVAAGRGESVRTLYAAFAEAGATEDAFMALSSEATAGMARSVRAFLGTDYSLADPAWVVRSLRAGRL
jgi:hypothetical protein